MTSFISGTNKGTIISQTIVHYVGSSEEFGTQPQWFVLLCWCWSRAEAVWPNTKPVKSKDMIDS